jgi:3-deoxy-D-manno-octulosonate 8-phosphate phosphatase (KDO 8-P phosphatase)
VLARFARVKLLLCDVDGVLTDATVSIGSGMELKRFCVRDGLGQRFLQENGIRVGWISNRPSPATAQRAEELKVDYLFQERGSKVAAIEAILQQAGLGWEEVCYVGDDVVDLGPLKRAGVAVVVANGAPDVMAVSHYVTRTPGGQGAVREVVEWILQAQGRWRALLEAHST